MFQGNYYPISSFKGGYCGNLPITKLSLEQASDLDNIVVLPSGQGFRTRHGNVKWHLATKVIQDITYTSVAKGTDGEAVTIAYTAGATAGSEVVTVVGNAISIQIESTVSTATQVKAKFDASAAAVALATAVITGTAGTAQVAVVAVALACTALNSGANIQGIGHFLQADQDKWLIVVAGAKIYSSSAYNGSYSEITGTATVTAAADNHWDIFTFNDKVIGFGGAPASPDAPWTWTGASTAAPLGGTAPSCYGGFSANNRVFAYRTSSLPSTIYWSIIGDPTDWTGTGAGSAVIGSLSDGQRVTAAIVISTNYVLVFKENATYQMVISSSPFPVYSLFDNVGCVGKKAAVNIDGEVYFINSRGEMCSTNGESVKKYPPAADNLWDAVQPSRYPYIVGFRETESDHDWLVWMVSTTGSTNTAAIIWDLENECWLQCTTGYDMNMVGLDHLNNPYIGDYSGFVYRPSVSAHHRDDSTSPGTVTGYWRSGWMNPSNATEVVQVRRMTVNCRTQTSGTITVNYGFDFTADSASFTLSQVPTASETYTSRGSMLTGRGNFFNFKISQSSAVIDTEVHSILLQGKSYGQKVIDND